MNVGLLSELETGLAQVDRIERGVESGDADAVFGAMLQRAAQVAGDQSPEYGLAMRARASAYRGRGEAARALEEYERALPLLERAGDEGRIQVAQTLTSIAALHAGLGGLPDAIAAAERATALIAGYALEPQRFAPPRPAGTRPPSATAVTAMLASDLADALASSPEAALHVFDEIAAKTAVDPAMRLALLLARAGFEQAHDSPTAPEAFMRAWHAAWSKPTKDVAQPEQWVQLGDLALDFGRTTEALKVARRLRALETSRDEDAGVLENLYQARRIEASVASMARSPAATEKGLRELLEFCRGAFGPSDDRTIVAETSLGRFLTGAGRATDALEMLGHAANARVNGPSYPDPQAAAAVFDLAWALDKAGQDTQAMTYYAMAYRVYARTLGPTNAGAMESALNLAETARIARDHETAERWFETVLEAERAGPDPRGKRVAHALNNLAETLLDVGRAAEAAPLAEQALQMRSELFGKGSAEYRRSLGVVARAALARQDRARLEEVVATVKQLDGSTTISLPVEVAMGYLELRGDTDQAIAVGRRGIELAEHTEGDSLVPAQAMSLRFALGALCARAQRWADAKASLFDALRMESTALSDEAGLRSGRQIRTMFEESRARIGTLLDVLAEDPQRTPDDVRQAYEVIQQRRGLETRLMRLQKPSFITDRALTSVPQERLDAVREQVMDIVSRLREAREEWLAALIREAEHAGPDPDGLSIVARQDRVEWFERQLAGYVGQGSRDFELLGVGSSMPIVAEDHAVVEYVYASTPAPTYYAFVVRQGGLQFMSLGEAGQIQQALLQLRGEITDGAPDPDDPDPSWRRRGRFLTNRLLRPLLPWLDGTAQLYVVPDADLFTLPFDLLPLDDGRLAIDRWTITHLWNGGELARFNVILGNPPSPKPPVVLAAPASTQGAGDQPWHFAALPFAEREGAALTRKLGAVCLAGPDATKNAVVASADAEVLHFATHSFYVSPAEAGARASDETPLLYRARSMLSDPMLRSGIALAGADLELGAPTAASPGILFASEVLELDLRNTDLAVLSSCQSGLGDPHPGDGIHGLRRAFRAAGCGSVVSSLWKVPDEATCEFMIDLYDRLLAQTPRGQALREAKLGMRARHATDPLFWAGFVLDGSDRPLFRFSGMQGLRIANVSGVGLSYDLALDQIAHGRSDEAVKQLEFVLNSRTATDELRAQAAATLATLFRQTGRLQDSLALWDQLVTDTRTPADLWTGAVVGRAVTKQVSGDLEGAYTDYTSALRSVGASPEKRAWLLVNRGMLFMQQEKLDLALADWNEVIGNPGSPADQRWKALLNRADVYRRTRRYADAISDATTLVSTPDAKGTDARAKAYIVLALCRSEQGDLPGAIAAIRQHLEERNTTAPEGVSKQLAACTTDEELKAVARALM